RAPGASGRQRHWICPVRVQPQRKMARAAQRDRTRGDASGSLRDTTVGSGVGQYAIIQAMAPSFGVELRPIDLRNPGEIGRRVVAFAREPNSGLIIVGAPPGLVHRDLILTLPARHRLPAVSPYPYFAHSGGLVSYGPDAVSHFRLAAGYVDRILKGEKPGDLPVQAPTKYELVINLKTAKALGIEVPPTLLARADEV